MYSSICVDFRNINAQAQRLDPMYIMILMAKQTKNQLFKRKVSLGWLLPQQQERDEGKGKQEGDSSEMLEREKTGFQKIEARKGMLADVKSKHHLHVCTTIKPLLASGVADTPINSKLHLWHPYLPEATSCKSLGLLQRTLWISTIASERTAGTDSAVLTLACANSFSVRPAVPRDQPQPRPVAALGRVCLTHPPGL